MEYLNAFLCGGLLCAVGQIILDRTNLTPARILTGYVVAGVFLQAVGVYQYVVDWGGAGATVPLTGFGYLRRHRRGRGVRPPDGNFVPAQRKALTNTPEGYIMQPSKKYPREVSDMNECCCHKTKHRSPQEQKQLTNRLSRIEGQVRGLRDMLQADAYCPDILVQVSAVSAALNSFSKELLATHIRTCVADGIRQGDDEVIDELVTTLQKMMK